MILKLAAWEKHRDDDAASVPVTGFTSNERAFAVVVRNAMFRRAELFSQEKEEALAGLQREQSPGSDWADPDRWADALDGFFDDYEDVYVDAKSRSLEHFRLDKNPPDKPGFWHAVQVLDDNRGNHDWGIHAWIDLAASDEAETAVVTVHHVGELRDV